MSSLSALNVDLVYQRTKGSAHPKGPHGHGNKELSAKENNSTSPSNKDVIFSPAAKRIERVLNVELSASLHATFSQSTSLSQGESERGLHRAYQATEKSASQVARAQLAAKLAFENTSEETGDVEELSDDVPSEAAVVAFDTEAVVDNVMHVVAQRLIEVSEQGASDEEIEALAKQAKAGVAEGLQQAQAVLEKLNEYNDRLQEHLDVINNSINTLIDDAVAALTDGREQAASENESSDDTDVLISGVEQVSEDEQVSEVEQVPSSQQPVMNESQASIVAPAESGESYEIDDVPADVSEQSELNRLDEWFYQRGVKVKQSNELQLQIRTNDGDVLTIVAKEGLSYRERMQASDSQLGNHQRFSLDQHQQLTMRSNFIYQVEGDLDEGEAAALDQLFAQVNELADKFYSGDLSAAADIFAQFEFDSSELASMDLTLQSRQSMQMREAYRAILATEGDRPASYWPQVSSLHQALLGYLSEVHERVNQLNQDHRLPNLGQHLEILLPGAIENHPHHVDQSHQTG